MICISCINCLRKKYFFFTLNIVHNIASLFCRVIYIRMQHTRQNIGNKIPPVLSRFVSKYGISATINIVVYFTHENIIVTPLILSPLFDLNYSISILRYFRLSKVVVQNVESGNFSVIRKNAIYKYFVNKHERKRYFVSVSVL